MKKKLLGISLLAICTTFSITKIDFNIGKDNGLVLNNIEAYASDSEGGRWKCYGPKVDGTCKCENSVECKDLKGCQ